MATVTNNSVTLKKFLIRNAAPVVRRQMLALAEQAQDLASQAKRSLSMVGALPDFIIIGTQKGGTTYLYDELMRQPSFSPARTKEIHFFDTYYHRGADWYRAFFPVKNWDGSPKRVITGEASPSYLYHPHAAKRACGVTPGVKLIVLLRNPVERAYSHYHHEVRLGFENLSFEEALEQEEARLAGERERQAEDETYNSYTSTHFSYKARGHYADQLQAWHRYFPKRQLLVLATEQLQRDPTATLKRVGEFLGLEDWQPTLQIKPKIFPYPSLDTHTRERLAGYFAPHNQRLYDYVGADYGWNA